MQFGDLGQPPTSPFVAASARWVSSSGKLLAYSEHPVRCHFVGSGARLRTDAPTRNSPAGIGFNPDRSTPGAVEPVAAALVAPALRAAIVRAFARAAADARAGAADPAAAVEVAAGPALDKG